MDNGYGDSIEIHFLALFSKRTDAVPLAMYHGWPGSVLEFLGVLDLLRKKYTPDTLPYHIVVPSLPGFGYSGSPPMTMDWGLEDAAMALDALMRGLGLQGYFAQGGDLGAYVCQYQAAQCEACRGLHLQTQMQWSSVLRQGLQMHPLLVALALGTDVVVVEIPCLRLAYALQAPSSRQRLQLVPVDAPMQLPHH